MTESDIDLQEIGFNAPEVLCLGGVEASVIYINNEPLQYDTRAKQGECGSATSLTVIPVSSAANMVSNGLVTSEDMIANHPDQVKAFVAAFDQALRETINNPAEAYLLSAAAVENLPLDDAFKAALQATAANQTEALMATPAPDRASAKAARQQLIDDLSKQFDDATLLQFRVLLASIDLWDADKLGSTTPEAWQTTEDTLMSLDFIKEPINLSAAYTEAFLP
jgi:NitT/TauT family transport system substrate-binding protein